MPESNFWSFEICAKIRCGDFRKAGPGARAKAADRKNAKAGKFRSGSSIIPGADALVPPNQYFRHHQDAPLSCKPRVKFKDGPFQGGGYGNQPPPKFDKSNYQGGPSPFVDKFDYSNSNHTRLYRIT